GASGTSAARGRVIRRTSKVPLSLESFAATASITFPSSAAPPGCTYPSVESSALQAAPPPSALTARARFQPMVAAPVAVTCFASVFRAKDVLSRYIVVLGLVSGQPVN